MESSPFLHDWVFGHAARTPDAPAIATVSVRLTYGELAERVRTLAGLLMAAGIGRGDRLLVALPNTPATVVVGLAINALGGTALEASRVWGAEMLAGIAARGHVRGAFVWGQDVRAWNGAPLEWPLERLWVVERAGQPAAPHERPGGTATRLLVEDGTLDPSFAPKAARSFPELQPDDPALVLFTSGSTGTPRGVIQTFRNIDANTRSIVEYLRLTTDDRAMLTLPLHYCYGRSVLQTHLHVGASLFLENRTAFPRVILESMAAESSTGFAGVPLTFELFRRQVDVSSISLPGLRYVTQAGGPMAPETIAWARDSFRPAQLYVMYGQTEATARLSYLPPEMADAKAGSIGRGIPGVELRVVDERGNQVPVGEIGELAARGANVTPGYLDEPEETAAILVDGWLRTGDLAYRDEDGYLFLRGRTREMLKIAGHRVSPVEIEQVVACHPDVVEAAVFGRKDDLAGEVPVSVVVLRQGATLDDATLRRACQERLPPYAVPVAFHSVDALPRNEAGKLRRDVLMAQFAASTGRGGADGATG